MDTGYVRWRHFVAPIASNTPDVDTFGGTPTPAVPSPHTHAHATPLRHTRWRAVELPFVADEHTATPTHLPHTATAPRLRTCPGCGRTPALPAHCPVHIAGGTTTHLPLAGLLPLAGHRFRLPRHLVPHSRVYQLRYLASAYRVLPR